MVIVEGFRTTVLSGLAGISGARLLSGLSMGVRRIRRMRQSHGHAEVGDPEVGHKHLWIPGSRSLWDVWLAMSWSEGAVVYDRLCAQMCEDWMDGMRQSLNGNNGRDGFTA